MTFPAGTRLGSHEIVAPIGAGGMGEVYRARDTKLGRDVALKVLPAEMASSPERLERFQREARAVAALNHPHIVTIHSVEESGGVHFLTMELVEGRPLDLVIAEGTLPVVRLVEIATALADALGAAHEKGIIHRDLKPANVMVGSGGRVKVLDFGLAKVDASAGAASDSTGLPTEMKTQEGVVMGTVPYMSPEQVQGRPLDLRTDIFSLGIILFEMATGQRPFHGESSAELVSSILRDTPPSVVELRADLPSELGRVIGRCLEKSVAERFPSAQELRYGLRGVPTGATPIRAATPTLTRPPAPAASGAERAGNGLWVAVLPFKYGGDDIDLEALADGLSEEIVTGLSRFRYLSVVSSASAARLKGEAGDERALGAKLGARYVLEGSLRKGGSAIRVSAQLVDAQSGAKLWAETYNRDLQTSSTFEVQDDVTARIVATVADSFGVLVHAMRSASRQKNDVDLTPEEWQFQYFAFNEQFTPATHAALKTRLERVMEQDDRQSDTWACLAHVYVDEYAFGFSADATVLDRALAAARRAVELDRANQFALLALARAHFFRQDLAAFGPAAERAMALNPLNTAAVGMLGLLIVHTGEFARGAAIVRGAMELNPNHAGWMHFAPLWEHFQKGEYQQALERANRVDVPGAFWPYLVMASACGHLGRRGEAAAAVRDLLALDPEFAAHARSKVDPWHFASGLMEPILEGLRKAGLEVDGGKTTTPAESDSSRFRPPGSGVHRADEGFWVAVLPFQYGGTDAELAALAGGLTDDVVTGLSRFSYLRVIARSSTSRYANAAIDVRSAGKELGARYVMEGTLRQSGGTLRLGVQLVDALSGAHLWAENYERGFRPGAVFEIQDDLVPRIVSTVGDAHGILPHTMSESLRGRAPAELSPYEAVLRSFGFGYRSTSEEHAAVRDALETAVESSPRHADAWAMLSVVYAHEYAHEFNVRPDPLGRAFQSARRAVDIAPSNALAYDALAWAHFFRKEFPAFRVAAAQAIALNPLNSPTLAGLGTLTAYSGEWEKGCALVERALQLNPRHPGWYRFALFANAYRQSDYRGAVDIALKLNLPDFYVTHEVLAAAYGQLGEPDQAAKALKELLRMRPDYAQTGREKTEKWFDPELVEHWMDGLRKAGLEIPQENGTAAPSPLSASASASGAARADEGFWVAVLPFRYGGSSADLTALAEGLTGDVVTGLARFSYLRVIARGSTLRYTDQPTDLRIVGKELGARYVMEGSLRQSGNRLRLAVQLVEAVSGAHLWAENYERTFSPDALFELQDELVPRIVSTVADIHGILPRSMSEALRGRPPELLSPYEAVVRSFGYFDRVTAEELAAARSGLESAVRQAPDHVDAWAMLALLCVQDYAQGFELQRDCLARGLTAARRAVEAAPSNHLAHFALAQALFFQKEFQSFRNAAERALALNPCDGNSIAFLGELMTYAGDRERGLALAERAKRLNPHHPGWYWYADVYNAYRRGDDRGAIGFVLKADLAGHWGSHAALAAAYGQLGDRDGAGKALAELLKLRPDYGARVRRESEKWWDPEYVERWIDGLRKAGLDGPVPARSDSAATLPAAIAIAVLPFSDMSPAKDQEYLCEGMAEEIMNALVRVEGIRVASRTSAFRARKDGGDLPAIARALSVSHVLEGSVRAAGDRLRVTAQLTDATSGFQLWSERFDRKAEDIFAVQDEIAAGVVEAVKARLSPGEHVVSVRPRSTNLEAYRSYLKGRHLRGKEDLAGALGAFEESIRLDPSYAPSWTGLAEITVLASVFGVIPARQACETARDALARAKQLQGESADGLHVEAFVAWIERRWAEMEIAWRRAIALQPTHVQALASFGIVLCTRQRLDEALPFFERARQSDPLASFPYSLTGNGLLGCGRPQEALRYLEDALCFEKEDATALDNAGMAKVVLGRLDEGIATLEHVVAISHRGPHFLGTLGWALATAGRTAEARAILEELRARPPSAPPVVSEAWLLGALGEIDAAFDVVARAEEECQAYVYFTGLPGFDPLRGDPRFAALLARLGLPPA